MKNKKTTGMDLELGQMVHGNPVGEFVCPEHVKALIAYIFEEIDRIYWNKNQKEWCRDEDMNFGKIYYRPYYWGEDEKEAAKPNFKYGKIELRFYKHFGRSMTVNISMTEKQWVIWFNKCLKHIRKQEPRLY